MRYVIVPPNVQLVNFATGDRYKKRTTAGDIDDEPYTMLRWLLDIILQDPGLSSERSDRIATREVRKAFTGTVPGSVIAVQDTHWSRLKSVVERLSPEVTRFWPATALEQFFDFEEEWCEAKPDIDAAMRRKDERFPDLS